MNLGSFCNSRSKCGSWRRLVLEHYDTQVEVLLNGTANAMRRQVLPQVHERFAGRDQRQLRLLDIGCGTGRLHWRCFRSFRKRPRIVPLRDIASVNLDTHVFGMRYSFKEVEMGKRVLVLTTTAAILACGAIGANAQAPSAQVPGTEQGSILQPAPGGPMQPQDQTGLQRRAQAGEHEDSDQDDFFSHHRGMMGGGMMGPGMMGGRMAGGTAFGHRDRGHDVVGPMMMRMMFSLMDADGDGKLSLQEFQAAHERIFKAMDTNKDGFVTLEEMQGFIRGTGPASR